MWTAPYLLGGSCFCCAKFEKSHCELGTLQNYRDKVICIRIGHYGAIQMLYYYYYYLGHCNTMMAVRPGIGTRKSLWTVHSVAHAFIVLLAARGWIEMSRPKIQLNAI